MDRYKNGKIYTLRSHQTDKYYIGSTCLPLHKRLYKHKGHYKEYTSGTRKSCPSSHEIIKHGDAYIELLEDCPCETKAQLLKREGELIREHKASIVNKHIAGNCLNNPNYNKETSAEYRKQFREKVAETKRKWAQKNRKQLLVKKAKYRKDNKAHILKDAKRCRELNKEEIKKWQTTVVACECGAQVQKSNLSRHKKSKKHLNSI